MVSITASRTRTATQTDGSTRTVAVAAEADRDVPLLALGAIARLATLDDAEASRTFSAISIPGLGRLAFC
jgi:hypothetical protein